MRVKQLSAADRDYYRSRMVQEVEAANAASCSEARMAHEQLAAAYRLLCSLRQGRAGPHLASELSMFQFGRKPAD